MADVVKGPIKRTCIGFGEREGKCENPAGTPWTPLWCTECDEERKASISRDLKDLLKSLEPK